MKKIIIHFIDTTTMITKVDIRDLEDLLKTDKLKWIKLSEEGIYISKDNIKFIEIKEEI